MCHDGSHGKNLTKDIAKVLIGQGIAQLIALASYLSDFTRK